MLTETQKNFLLNRLPSSIGGVTVSKVKTGQIGNRVSLPSLFLTFPTQGVRVHFWADQIRRLWHGSHEHIFYGQIDRATLSIIVESTSYEQCSNLVEGLYRYIWETELYLDWSDSKMRMAGVFNPIEIPSRYDEKLRLQVYRFSIDVYVDYEFTWEDNSHSIKRFNFRIGTDENYVIELEDYAPGTIGMSLILISKEDG